jgi:2-iminobutanoate/2-iminopropanoate deaminase
VKTVPVVPSLYAPIGPYSVAAEAAGLVFLSGQLGIDPASGERSSSNVRGQTVQVMSNIRGILNSLDLDFADIVKTTIFLLDMSDYPTVNEVYGSYFPDDPPTRSALQAVALPGGYLVEIEVVAAR